MRSIISLSITLALAATTGCSLSNSSGSISDSISSPSESISDSSSSSSDGDSGGDDAAPAPETAEDTASYQQDVSQLTVTYIKSGGDLAAFATGIASLATARGITDWEADSATTQAIGLGAGNAGLDETAFNDFSKQLFGEDLTKLNELRIGYQEAAPTTPTTPAAPTVAAPAAESAPEAATDTVSQPEMQSDAQPDAS